MFDFHHQERKAAKGISLISSLYLRRYVNYVTMWFVLFTPQRHNLTSSRHEDMFDFHRQERKAAKGNSLIPSLYFRRYVKYVV
jgi:hypothetical protein